MEPAKLKRRSDSFEFVITSIYSPVNVAVTVILCGELIGVESKS